MPALHYYLIQSGVGRSRYVDQHSLSQIRAENRQHHIDRLSTSGTVHTIPNGWSATRKPFVQHPEPIASAIVIPISSAIEFGIVALNWEQIENKSRTNYRITPVK